MDAQPKKKFFSGMSFSDFWPLIKIALYMVAIFIASKYVIQLYTSIFGKKPDPDHVAGVADLMQKGVPQAKAEQIQSNYESNMTRAGIAQNIPGLGTWLMTTLSVDAANTYINDINNNSKQHAAPLGPPDPATMFNQN